MDITAQLQALLASIPQAASTETLTITVGLSKGLFESALKTSSFSSLKFDYQGSQNLKLTLADVTLDVEQTEALLGKFQAAAKAAEGVFHIRSSINMDIAEEVMDAFDDCEGATYLNLTFSLSSDIITGKKVTDNEGVVKPSIKFGGIQKLLSFSAGTNPMAERGVLATEDELLELIKKDAERSRTGFNNWAASQSNNGKTEQQVNEGQAALDALLTSC